jgi:hypothetical protein
LSGGVPVDLIWPIPRQAQRYHMKAWKFPHIRAALTVPGIWDSEPDKIQLIDVATDLDCLAVRADGTGAWCGYVGVPPGHPWHGMDAADVPASVHGGLTYSAPCAGGHGGDDYAVCHTPEPGRPDNVWWVGFDCGHGLDVWPAHLAMSFYADMVAELGATYRPLGYVMAQILDLAGQAHSAARPATDQ